MGRFHNSIPQMGQFFPTTGPTFKRHVHKWADRMVKRDVNPRQCDEDQTAVYLGRAIILITYPYGDLKHLLLYAWLAGITKTRRCNIRRFLAVKKRRYFSYFCSKHTRQKRLNEAVLTSTYIKVGCKGVNITWTC